MPSHPLALTGLHHVALRVADLDRSLVLYRDTLGLPVKFAFTLDNRRFALLDVGNAGYVELIEMKQAVRSTTEHDVLWHLALRTDNLDRTLEAVVKGGYTVIRDPADFVVENTVSNQPFPVRVAFFRGPDGEEVELLQERSAR
jgi:glyoxylase I family protein